MNNRISPVDLLMYEAFGNPRDPRSKEYKHGVRAALEYRFNGVRLQPPYEIGTTAFDAYASGLEEGHRRWRDAHLNQVFLESQQENQQ